MNVECEVKCVCVVKTNVHTLFFCHLDLPHMCSTSWWWPKSCDRWLCCSSNTWTQSTQRLDILFKYFKYHLCRYEVTLAALWKKCWVSCHWTSLVYLKIIATRRHLFSGTDICWYFAYSIKAYSAWQAILTLTFYLC